MKLLERKSPSLVSWESHEHERILRSWEDSSTWLCEVSVMVVMGSRNAVYLGRICSINLDGSGYCLLLVTKLVPQFFDLAIRIGGQKALRTLSSKLLNKL